MEERLYFLLTVQVHLYEAPEGSLLHTRKFRESIRSCLAHTRNFLVNTRSLEQFQKQILPVVAGMWAEMQCFSRIYTPLTLADTPPWKSDDHSNPYPLSLFCASLCKHVAVGGNSPAQ